MKNEKRKNKIKKEQASRSTLRAFHNNNKISQNFHKACMEYVPP